MPHLVVCDIGCRSLSPQTYPVLFLATVELLSTRHQPIHTGFVANLCLSCPEGSELRSIRCKPLGEYSHDTDHRESASDRSAASMGALTGPKLPITHLNYCKVHNFVVRLYRSEKRWSQRIYTFRISNTKFTARPDTQVQDVAHGIPPVRRTSASPHDEPPLRSPPHPSTSHALLCLAPS